MKDPYMNPRFPIREGFSSSCSTACSQANIDPSIQKACDLGSFKYCSDPTVVSSDNCTTFIDRVIRSRTAAKTNVVYSNPVSVTAPQTIDDYYNALGSATNAYIQKNIGNLSDPSMAKLMTILESEKGENTMYTTAVDAAIDACAKDPTNAGCNNTALTWLTDRITQLANTYATTNANSSLVQIASDMTKSARYIRFPSLFQPVTNLILSKLTISLISDPTVIALRAASSVIATGIDVFVINYVMNKESLTSLTTDTTGAYNVDISLQKKLYDSPVRTFYNLIKSSGSDKLAALIASADTANIQHLSTVNTDTDPLAIAMKQTGESAIVGTISNLAKGYCTTTASIITPDCITYINGSIGNASFNKDSAFSLILSAATKSDGSLDRTILDKYTGMSDWLASKTADIVSVDSNGVSTIMHTCGTPSGLSIDQCKAICIAYPDICVKDQVTRCAIPQYRYAQEGFYQFNGEDYDDNSQLYLFIIFIAIVVLGCLIKWASRVKQYHIKKQTTFADATTQTTGV